MDSSGSVRTKSAFQYHCKPGAYRPSNMPLKHRDAGIGPTMSSAGALKLRIGLNIFAAF